MDARRKTAQIGARPRRREVAAGAVKGHAPQRPTLSKNAGRESAESRHLSNSAAENNVLVDLPALLPVTEGELDLLERELLPFIGDILRPSR